MLLLAAVFIGLFAGAEHKYRQEKDSRKGPSTSIGTTTVFASGTTTLAGPTVTATATTTLPAPTTGPAPPLPTGDPDSVSAKRPLHDTLY